MIQRPLRGSRISSFYPIKSLPPLASLDSAFQLQEYISLLIRLDVHDVDHIVAIPGKTDADPKPKDAEKKPDKEVIVDQACWIYEQLRRLAQDLTHPLITTLQQECTRLTCPEMKAGEWLYLCVAHGTDGAMEQCCAIDYILHTLDSATALLNSPRAFPSRLHIDKTSHRHFSSLARRLGRIFAHAYFHHREAFEQAEAESSLYARFLALTTKFELVPAEFQVIPSRTDDIDVPPPRLLAAGVDTTESEDESKNGREKSNSPPGLRNESPRKIGRNRTDTMVYSEAFSVVEELAKEEDAIVASFAEEEEQEEEIPKPKSLSPEPLFVDEPQPVEQEPAIAHPEPTPAAAGVLRPEPGPDTDELVVTASSSTALEPLTDHVEVFQAESPVVSTTPDAPAENVEPEALAVQETPSVGEESVSLLQAAPPNEPISTAESSEEPSVKSAPPDAPQTPAEAQVDAAQSPPDDETPSAEVTPASEPTDPAAT
ncbi:Mob1/phocein [Hymenopellis radicata]|nr:Mob1/phocein [Hymenopellis radicata]